MTLPELSIRGHVFAPGEREAFAAPLQVPPRSISP